ncbi:TetR/AcrR family transcriptional regulator [Streptomyces hyaluromycini]|uniref:TetR/AcrR family transcriptional regulator n=1 Tax=Streptomyces hyaluromycini TaxID=1377993 RepID=UPI000B5C5D49|nr:TetR/AcrR family transcriptional regulator [Streptomyces hyaluromycini]
MNEQGSARPVRAHARRNREKLVAAALEEFTRTGKDAPLDGIARAAGVGIGTLYRHFPTRESLVLAAYEHEVDQLCADAADLLATLPPDRALREFMGRLAGLLVTKQHMSQALRSGGAEESYSKVYDTIDTLFTAGVAAGTLRADMATADVVRAMGGLLRLDVAGDWKGQADRQIRLLMDGLYTGAPARAEGREPER